MCGRSWPFTRRSGGTLWMHRSGVTGKRPAGCGRERGNRPNATKRPAGRDRESTRLERWARKARGRGSNGQTVSNRSTGRTTAGTIVFAARKRHAKHESSQLVGEECRSWRGRLIAGVGGVGTVTMIPMERAGIARQLSCDSNAPKPNDRAAHGSPSWPADNWQATEQRKSALSETSSTLRPAIKQGG